MKDICKYNITVFGDSTAKGIMCTDGKIARAEKSAFDIVASHYNINIDNISVFGQRLSRLVEKELVDEYIQNIDKSANNCVILFLGGNDSDFDWASIAKTPNIWHDPYTPIDTFTKLLNDVVQKLKDANVKVILTTLIPMDAQKFYNTVIARQTEKERVLPFLSNDVFSIYKYQERYSLEIMHCARLNDCPILDVRAELLTYRNYHKIISCDGIHPTELGYKQIGEIIIRLLDKID